MMISWWTNPQLVISLIIFDVKCQYKLKFDDAKPACLKYRKLKLNRIDYASHDLGALLDVY